ncbi:MAG TPA: hypothetical protein ENK31_01790 [Nannocystis exedens]|nr:hypothetical protein [Nannocystis exedens]
MSTESPPVDPPVEGSPLPAILAGVAILAVAAFLIFGSGSSEQATEDARGAKGGQAGMSGDAKAGAGGRVRGGVGARAADAAQGRSGARRNPKLGSPIEGMKLNPSAPPEPPNFESKEEEIAYFEKKLERERELLEQRARFVERVKKAVREAPSAEERSVAEGRSKIVSDNYAQQQEAVKELEAKVARLKG